MENLRNPNFFLFRFSNFNYINYFKNIFVVVWKNVIVNIDWRKRKKKLLRSNTHMWITLQKTIKM